MAGSNAAGRVGRGLCPHCGSSMPRGYTVGFAKSSSPPKYDYDALVLLRETRYYKFFCTALNGALAALFLVLNRHFVYAVVVGVVVIGIGVLYYLMALKPHRTLELSTGRLRNETTDQPITNKLLIASWLLCFPFALYAAYAENLPYWYLPVLISFGVSLVLQIPMWRRDYRWAVKSLQSYRQKNNDFIKELPHRLLDPAYSKKYKTLHCAKCRSACVDAIYICENSHILCPKCAKSGFRNLCLKCDGKFVSIIDFSKVLAARRQIGYPD